MRTQVHSEHLPAQAQISTNPIEITLDELDEAIENVPSIASGEVMDGNAQMTILNRMAKLEAKFEKFLKRFEPPDGSGPSDMITGPEEYKTFDPIDSVEKLDEFEQNLKDPEFENKTVCVRLAL